MVNYLNIINQRVSVRTYALEKEIVKEKLQILEKYAGENSNGPFNKKVRFKILLLDNLSSDEVKKLGTYGVIKGAKYYLLGVCENKANALIDLGYCMEKIILKATELGLATCWLGGTFRRSSFAMKVDLSSDEILPAISPIGYAAAKKRLVEKVMKIGARSSQRKPFASLFFKDEYNKPFLEEEMAQYRDLLQGVRLAPSSMNRQPWRIIKVNNKFDFYLFRKQKIKGESTGIDMLKIDLGIAMAHFDLLALGKGMDGDWINEPPQSETEQLEYIISWQQAKN